VAPRGKRFLKGQRFGNGVDFHKKSVKWRSIRTPLLFIDMTSIPLQNGASTVPKAWRTNN